MDERQRSVGCSWCEMGRLMYEKGNGGKSKKERKGRKG